MKERGFWVGPMRPSEANRLLKSVGSAKILDDYFDMCSWEGSVDSDTVWTAYAVKQKRHHINGKPPKNSWTKPKKYHQQCSACYVCGKQVGTTDDEEYPWESTVVVKGNKCRNITNHRICCEKCHHGSRSYDTLYEYAVSVRQSKKTSLAVRDKITNLVEAYKVYHHKYAQ